MATVTHYLITNRRILKDTEGKEFINPGGDESVTNDAQVTFRFAHYSFDEGNINDEGRVTLVEDLKPSIKEKDIVNEAVLILPGEELKGNNKKPKAPDELSGSNQVFMELYQIMCEGKGDILFFIHGFKSDLSVTLKTIRNLHKAYVRDDSGIKVIVTFTWPARKNLLLYLDDQHDARFSGYAFARVFQRFHDFLSELFLTTNAKQCNQAIHLMCHSMGNQVLYYMLERLIENGLDRPETFKQAILVAADIPFDSFNIGEPLNELIDICEQVHVYYHRGDLALAASSVTKLRQNRLGRVGFKDSKQLPDDTFEVNVTDVPTDDTDSTLQDLLQLDQDELIKHWYYLTNQKVIEDIRRVLKTGRSVFPTNPPQVILV